MKKYEATWYQAHGKRSETVFYSIRENKFFRFRRDFDKLEEKYGGKIYYQSRSGKQGAGFLLPDAAADDLLQVGSYNQITPLEKVQESEIVIDCNDLGQVPKKLSVYVNTESENTPIVIIDKNMNIILYHYEDNLQNAFMEYFKLEEELSSMPESYRTNKSITYYSEYPKGYSESFDTRQVFPFYFKRTGSKLLMDYNKVDYRKFLCVLNPNIGKFAEAEGVPWEGQMNCLYRMTDILYIDGCWYHYNHEFDYFDARFETDPREMTGSLIAGWVAEGNGLFWRRNHRNGTVFCFIERNRSQFKKNYDAFGAPEYVDYEMTFSALKFFRVPGAVRDIMEKQLLGKVRKDFCYFARNIRNIKRIKEIMAENPEVRINVTDSLETGNCMSGTSSFMKQFEIDELSYNFREILALPDLDKMLNNYAFTKTVFHVLKKAGIAMPEDIEIDRVEFVEEEIIQTEAEWDQKQREEQRLHDNMLEAADPENQ